MPVAKLPSPQMGMNVEDLTNLMFRYYRELQYLLNGNLDEENVSRITTDQLIAGEAKIGTALIEDLVVGNNVTMGPDTIISWEQVAGTEEMLNDYITTGTMTEALSNTLNTGNFSTIITKNYIASMNLVVGNEILMGTNATISWNKVTDKPTMPDDAHITTITKNTITTAYVNALDITAKSIASDFVYAGNISASQITTGNLSADRISGGTLSGITIDISTDATVGDTLRVGPSYQYVEIYNSGGNGILRSNGSNVLKFINGGNVLVGNSLYILGGKALGYHTGLSTISGTDYIRFDGYSPYITMLKPVTFNEAVNLATISRSGNISINTTSYGNTITLNAYGTMDLTSSSGGINLTSSNSSYGIKLTGKVGFFGGSPTAKTSVADPSTISTGSAPSAWTQSWGNYVKTDLDNLRSKLTGLIDALQSYGLV